MRISVCIPTCNRPKDFREALTSAIEQTVEPFEIIVGDDSANDETFAVVEECRRKTSVPIRYDKNQPRKGQYQNVHDLLQGCHGELVTILHDDDLLEKDALERLVAPLQNPKIVASYGKQILINSLGQPNFDASVSLNDSFRRSAAFAGVQPSSLVAAVTQQFPNDCYLVRAAPAKQIGYMEPGRFRDACDFAFGVFYAQHAEGHFYFVDHYTARYRCSEDSVTSNYSYNAGFYSHLCVLELLEAQPECTEMPEIQRWLEAHAPVAIGQAARFGKRKLAMRWWIARYHRHKIFTFGGAKRLAKIALAR